MGLGTACAVCFALVGGVSGVDGATAAVELDLGVDHMPLRAEKALNILSVHVVLLKSRFLLWLRCRRISSVQAVEQRGWKVNRQGKEEQISRGVAA